MKNIKFSPLHVWCNWYEANKLAEEKGMKLPSIEDVELIKKVAASMKANGEPLMPRGEPDGMWCQEIKDEEFATTIDPRTGEIRYIRKIAVRLCMLIEEVSTE